MTPAPTTPARRLLRILCLATGCANGEDAPWRIRAWDGSEAGPPDAPLVVLRSRDALRRIVRRPDELGLGRAWVAGDVEVPGDLFAALDALVAAVERSRARGHVVTRREQLAILREAVLLGAVGREPAPPPEEARVAGRRHSRSRDRAAVRHHYDVGNAFYRRVLGPSWVYSCAYWERWDDPSFTLEDAQRAKLDLVCRKLALAPGMRLLDVGCGWGSLVLHAAQQYGVTAVGVTVAEEQAALARERVADAGLGDRVEIRLQDYRDVRDGPYDAIASVGMAEHVGSEQLAAYARGLHDLLRPAGRALHHAIARPPDDPSVPRRVREQPSFVQAYVFPDGELQPLGTTVSVLESAGFEVRDVQVLREHYGRTLRAWVANLEQNWDECVRLTSPGRARVWRLYLAGSALAFEAARVGVNQTLVVRPGPAGRANVTPVRGPWPDERADR